MITAISVIIIIVALLLMLLVLIQSPKNDGIAQVSSMSNKFFGVQNTIDFLEKTTWTLAAIILGLSLLVNVFYSDTVDESLGGSALQEQIEKDQSSTRPVAPPQQQPTVPPPTLPEDN